MDTKKHIIEKLEQAGLKIHSRSFNRYISGERTPSYQSAKILRQIIGGRLAIWIERDLREQRKEALMKYSQKIGGSIHFEKGRPLRGNAD